jgi:hypothetical protein
LLASSSPELSLSCQWLLHDRLDGHRVARHQKDGRRAPERAGRFRGAWRESVGGRHRLDPELRAAPARGARLDVEGNTGQLLKRARSRLVYGERGATRDVAVAVTRGVIVHCCEVEPLHV